MKSIFFTVHYAPGLNLFFQLFWDWVLNAVCFMEKHQIPIF